MARSVADHVAAHHIAKIEVMAALLVDLVNVRKSSLTNLYPSTGVSQEKVICQRQLAYPGMQRFQIS